MTFAIESSMAIDQTLISATFRSRPLSSTLIPRPVSGTSRRASSTLPDFVNQEAEDSARSGLSRFSSPFQVHHTPYVTHQSCRTRDGMPPTSFSKPKAMLARSDSLLPYNDRPGADLSGTREQLRFKPFSTQRFDTLSDVEAISSTSASAAEDDVQKSRTKPLLHKREITPRTLMKPIQPTLPCSQTTGNLICFAGMQDISPSKATCKSSLGPTLNGKNESRVDDVYASLWSRMTQREIEVMENVRGEAVINQNRSRPTESPSTPNGGAVAPEICRARKNDKLIPVTLNLSVNDIANTQRLEEQSRKPHDKRPLFVNTTLANTSRTFESSPLSRSTPQSTSTDVTQTSSEPTGDPRIVYGAEDTGYWIGRYVAATDRIQQKDCETLLKPAAHGIENFNINSAAFEKQFEKLEQTRKSRVLEELRQYCRTQLAQKSLERFESRLYGNETKSPSIAIRPYDEPCRNQKLINQGNMAPHTEHLGVRHHSGNSTTSQVSNFNAQATIEKISGIIARRGGLIKSKTTSSLTSSLASHTALATKTGGLSRSRPQEVEYEPDRKQSHSITQYKPWTKVVEAREMQPSTGKTDLGRKDNRITPDNIIKRQQPFNGDSHSILPIGEEWPLSSVQDQPRGGGKPSRIELSTTCANDEVTPLTQQHYTLSTEDAQQGHSNVTKGDIREIIVYQKKRGGRQSGGQSSGEFAKMVVHAGIREVRKMSRRVGSMGWGDSSDDLTNRFRTTAK